MKPLMIAAAVSLAACASAPPPPPVAIYSTLPDRAAAGLPYSDAVRVGDLLFLSGAIGTPPGSRDVVAGGVIPETRQVLEHIKRNLETHGSSLERVVKCTVMLTDVADFEAMNSVYREYFPRNKPARSTFGVNGLARGAHVEIECIAVVGPRGL